MKRVYKRSILLGEPLRFFFLSFYSFFLSILSFFLSFFSFLLDHVFDTDITIDKNLLSASLINKVSCCIYLLLGVLLHFVAKSNNV